VKGLNSAEIPLFRVVHSGIVMQMRESVVTTIGVAAALANPEYVENLLCLIRSTAESKGSDTKFLVWCPFQGFQILGRGSPRR
jgi:hypothetical protein